METFDVGIVGAGVHGASVAFHLASRGLSVVIFERWTPAGGPTGRSSAVCRAYYTNTFLATAARDSIAMMERFREITGVDAGFRRTGMLFLHPPEDVDDVVASTERLNDLGIDTSLFEPDRFVKEYPSFSRDGIGVAALERGAGYADPHATTEGLFRRAVELGAVGRVGVRVARRDGGMAARIEHALAAGAVGGDDQQAVFIENRLAVGVESQEGGAVGFFHRGCGG